MLARLAQEMHARVGDKHRWACTDERVATMLPVCHQATGNQEFIAMFTDVKLSGEATCQPHCRLASYRSARLKKLATSILRTRADPTH